MKDEHDRDTRRDSTNDAARREPESDTSDKRDARVDRSRRSSLPHHLRGDELEKNFEDADADSSDVANRRDDKISES